MPMHLPCIYIYIHTHVCVRTYIVPHENRSPSKPWREITVIEEDGASGQ